ncbi:MAG: hypothetical protein M3Y87_03115 [Myxococcota bacterium]|nr:hypothetical protein [Myxococcota bacterium]
MSPWLVTALLLVAAAAYRVVRVLTAENREALRRRTLLHDLKEFIGGAHRANIERAEELRAEKLLRHATIYVHGLPVTRLREADGIGAATVDSLDRSGYRTLEDVQQNDIRSVRAIGRVKFGAAQHFIRASIESANRRLVDGFDDIPRDPATETHYNQAIEELGVRNQRLDDDRDGLQPAADEVAAYEQRAAQRTAPVRLRELLRSPLDAIKNDPSRPLRFILLAAMFVTISAGLPYVAMGWDGSSPEITATLSVGAAYFAASFYLVVYSFASERAVRFGTRPLDPSSYQEQRLQFMGLQMALSRGIAPPEVRITSTSVTETRGTRLGPSLVALPDAQVKHLALEASQDAIEFMLAHEIGELSGDHQRVSTTTATLLAPFAWAAHQSVRAVAAWAGWLFRPQARFIESLFLCSLCMPFVLVLPFGLAIVCVYLSVAVIRVVLSADAVFAADRTARELTSSAAMKEMLGALSSKKRADDAEKLSAAIQLLVVEEVPPRHVRIARRINSWMDLVVNLRPTSRRRLRVIDHPGVPLVDVGLGVLRAVAILAIASAGLYVSGTQMHLMATVLSRPEHIVTAPPRPAAPASIPLQSEAPRVTRQIRVRGDGTSCVLRRGPGHDQQIVGSARTGTSCEVRAYDEHWVDAVCGHTAGFVGRGCVESPP